MVIKLYDSSGDYIRSCENVKSASWELELKGGCGVFSFTVEGVDREDIKNALLARVYHEGALWYSGIIQTVSEGSSRLLTMEGAGYRVVLDWIRRWAASWVANERSSGSRYYDTSKVSQVLKDVIDAQYPFLSDLVVENHGSFRDMTGYFTPTSSGYEVLNSMGEYDTCLWGITPEKELYFSQLPSSPGDYLTEPQSESHYIPWGENFLDHSTTQFRDHIINGLHILGARRDEVGYSSGGNWMPNPRFIESTQRVARFHPWDSSDQWWFHSWKGWVVRSETTNTSEPGVYASTGYYESAPSIGGGSGVLFTDYGPTERPDPCWVSLEPVSPAVQYYNEDEGGWVGFETNTMPEVVEGRDYSGYFSCWCEHSSYISLWVEFEWYDSDKNLISSDISLGTLHGGGGWERKSFTATAPTNAVEVQTAYMVSIESSPETPAQFMVDQCQFAPGGGPHEFQNTMHLERWYDVGDFSSAPTELQNSVGRYGLRMAFRETTLNAVSSMEARAEQLFLAYSVPYYEVSFTLANPPLIRPWGGLIQLVNCPHETQRYDTLDSPGLLGCEKVRYSYGEDGFVADFNLKSPRAVFGPGSQLWFDKPRTASSTPPIDVPGFFGVSRESV